MPVDTQLRKALDDMDAKYGDQMYKMLGSTLLSYTTTDSARMYMFTSHVKQVLTLLDPDVPRLATGFENDIGRYSNAYKRLDGVWEVKDVIEKYPDHPDCGILILVLYNKKTDTYDMIETPIAENLTEKFGFAYDASEMRKLHPGDKIKDKIIYKSTSFDEQMNYRMGKNAVVAYSTSTDTLEDALVVRKGWADGVKSVEVDDVYIGINTNEVMLNLYGDDSTYKTFPGIGEEVHDSLLGATRVINLDHLLYDFKKGNLRVTNDTDAEYYVSKHAVVYDINVFYNAGTELPDTAFYRQLNQYFIAGNVYAKRIFEWADTIKKSGSHYTDNVTFYRAKYRQWNNPEYSWTNKDRAFANLLVEFKVKAVVSLEYGSKITGRYGNKGVVSGIVDTGADRPQLKDVVGEMLRGEDMSEEEIYKLTSNIQVVEDARMPYTDDGPIDILLNSSGAIRRLNPGQLCEVEVNFIGEQVRKAVCKAETYAEKEELIFKFLDIVNENESTFFRTMYDSFDRTVMVDNVKIRMLAEDSRRAFIEDVEKNGFYLVRPPHKPLLYRDIIALYEAFPFIKPIPFYIDLFGIKHRKIIKEGICGVQYVLILKQNSNKNFSARSTFRVNRSNLPAKDITKKTNRSSYAKTPVRLSEIYNLFASISGRDLAEYNIFMRSSPLGSKSLDRILSATGNPLKITKLKVHDNYTNTNADILNARLKSIGLAIEFTTAETDKHRYPDDQVVSMRFYNYTVIDQWGNHEIYQKLFDRFMTLMRGFRMVEAYPGQKDDQCWDEIFSEKEFKDTPQDLQDQLRLVTKGAAAEFVRLLQVRREQMKAAMNPEQPQKKKRGRKPKKRPEEIVAETLAANEQDAINDASEYDTEYIEA